MPRLTIHHILDSEPPKFRLRPEQDGKTTDPVEIPSPYLRQVGGGDRSLMDELRWYLENFLEYPFDPWTDRADRTLEELEAWGREAFEVLFGGGDGQVCLDRARRDGEVRIAVATDDPQVLSWPWEGLRDPQRSWVVQEHTVTRRLTDVADPPPPSDVPDDRVNVLLVTARPFEQDIPYRSTGRPLVEQVEEKHLPASITLLRRPTVKSLKKHLDEHPTHYHVLHFDGHGGYLRHGGAVSEESPSSSGAQGYLAFESRDDLGPDWVPANHVSQLLRDHQIPTVVLDACQSGMVDDAADDAFASVGASLLRAGVRSVVAMSHSVMVSGAQEFIPPFYRCLFATGSLVEAARAGRREMLAHPERVSPRGRFPLQDWLVPVVYTQDEVSFDFVADAAPPTDDAPDLLPPEETKSPFGFVGRDRELLQLERAMQRNPPGILFHGLGGIGKTTLVWGFLRWLADTGGLTHEPFWFTFSQIQSAEYVLNRIGERFGGEEFATLDTDEKLDKLLETLDEAPCVLVWDNFESVAAMDEEAGEALLSERDRETLRTFFCRLRGTGTKVLITSRNKEEWLGGPEHVQRHALGGLRGEERWRFCEWVVADLPGVTLDREDDALKELMKTLRGHPLAMRVVLPQLADHSPGELEEVVRHNLSALDTTDSEARDRLYATLGLVEEVLDEKLQELLIPLRLHERFVAANQLEAMADGAESPLTRDQIDRGLWVLSDIGLLRDAEENALYAIHPALTGYLRAQEHGLAPDEREEAWTRAFVRAMAKYADHFAPKPLHEQRSFLSSHRSNVSYATRLADEHEWKEEEWILTKFLMSSAFNLSLFKVAERRGKQNLEIRDQLDEAPADDKIYRQLGRIAQERRDLDKAEEWYRKSINFKKRLGDECEVAKTYHNLGKVAQERRDLDGAEEWYREALEVFEQLGNPRFLAMTYNQLGITAQERRELEKAKEWYYKSLEIKEELGSEHLVMSTYHNLGILAEQRGDLEEAEDFYNKSLKLKVRLGNERSLAKTYHQLGKVAKDRGDLEGAADWLKKSLEIKERIGDKPGIMRTYHQFGILERKRGNSRDAENWHSKSLRIKQNLGDKLGTAKTYLELGGIEKGRDNLEEAEKWYNRALNLFENMDDQYWVSRTYLQLGRLARMDGGLLESGENFLMAIQGFALTNDSGSVQRARTAFAKTLHDAPHDVQADLRQCWIEVGFAEDALDDLPDDLE
jgi:tetratricopeptide (TPR) repeat protein